jgi:putative nucleotidyltransferase with HDIG domain
VEKVAATINNFSPIVRFSTFHILRIRSVSEHREERDNRWSARSRTGFFVSVTSFAIPIALSVVSAFTASVLLPHPGSSAWRVAWWIGVLLIAWFAAIVGERLARPLLPLASLLKMSLLFPDRAPSRFAVAWRSGSTRQLDRYVHGLESKRHREPLTTAVEILALVTALSSHDKRTRGHSERVRAYTDLIADELRLPQADRDRLRWSALLHDVGKMIVHVDILNKNETLTRAEWEIIRRHPQEGQRMIEPLMEWLGEWGHAVEQHHENFDGTGYPFGLSGNQISLGARIVSVADAFEVMTAARSYKSALSPAAARKELTRCAGTQFDPAIVRAFLDISVGRQRLIIGPLAWLFDVPIISQIGNLGNVLTVGSQVALVAGSVTLAAAAAGAHLVHPLTPPDRPTAVTAALIERQPEVVMVLSDNSMDLAGNVRGDASISNASPDVGGTVTYFVFNNDACANKGLSATLGPVNVKRGEVPSSPSWRSTGPAGTYYFVAAYSGDANNEAARSNCNSDPIAVGPGVETITVQLSSNTVSVGGEVYASAVIAASRSGAVGSVTYDVYNNDSCSGGGLVATLGQVRVTNGVVANSPNWMATGVPDTYYFVAVYGGDSNHKSAVSGCNGASVLVSSASPPGVTTTLSNNPGTSSYQPNTSTTTTKPTTPTTPTTRPTSTTTTQPSVTTTRPTSTTPTTRPTSTTTTQPSVTTTRPTSTTPTTTAPSKPCQGNGRGIGCPGHP